LRLAAGGAVTASAGRLCDTPKGTLAGNERGRPLRVPSLESAPHTALPISYVRATGWRQE